MNADEARRRDLAELARLLPDPAGRDLPAGRHLVLKELLMSEVRTTGRPPVSTPVTRRGRRKPTIIVLGAVAAVVAITLTLLPKNTPGASPAAVRLLAKIASVAAAQPSPHVRDSQFSYISAWVSDQVCIRQPDGAFKCTTEKPHETQVWQSVSNLCVPGLLREYGQDTPLTLSGNNSVHCPWPGVVNYPSYRFLQSLPTDPHALLSRIEREMQGQLPRPEETFATIGDLLGQTIAPPAVSAALYRAAALIPGVTVVADATDAIGRHGVAVAFTYQGTRTEWIFSRQTLQYLGGRDIDLADGSTVSEGAVLQRAFVDRPGQHPG
jgi:hypothetical protein